MLLSLKRVCAEGMCRLHFLGPKKILERIGVKEGYASLCHACDTIIRSKDYQKRILDLLDS